MFNKLTIIEPINMLDIHKNKLNEIAKEIIFYNDIPSTDEEILNRISDSDAILVSYTTIINSNVINKTTNLKYIGMCCSLYNKESANVDITACERKDIIVKGIRDYGDEGVCEYIIHELVEFLQGYNELKWSNIAYEITDLKCGVIGLGTSGGMIAKTLKFFKADVSYFSRTRKIEYENEGIKYKDLDTLCIESDAIFLALNKNILLLNKHHFDLMKGKKILFNTSIGPGFVVEDFKEWIKDENHFFFGDTLQTAGDIEIFKQKNTKTINRSAGGKSYQAYYRLGEKVLNNIYTYLKK